MFLGHSYSSGCRQTLHLALFWHQDIWMGRIFSRFHFKLFGVSEVPISFLLFRWHKMFWIVWIMWICKILETSWNIEIIFFWTEVDEPKGCYTEWSESEREKQILDINAYIWNLERWYWWTYLQGSNGDTKRTDFWIQAVAGSRGRVQRMERVAWRVTFPYVK